MPHTLPPADIAVVRSLATRCMELAASDVYEARRRRWRDVNERRKPDRAPVWCRPARVWRDLIPDSSLQCKDPFARSVETTFLQHLYKDWVGDDHIFDPWWEVPARWGCDREHPWGLPLARQVGSTDLGGFHYDPPIKDEADYDRLRVPAFAYDPRATEDAASRVSDLLGEAMPVRVAVAPALGPTLGTYLEKLRGMAPLMNDLAFCPHRVHRAMATITEGVLAACRVAEDTGLLTPNHTAPMVCSDAPNGGTTDGRVRLCNLWSGGNSQEFDQVSPAMFEEFLLNYQIPIFQQFGAVWYGCCENLTHKIDRVLRIPNLRVFVCSAWTDLERVVEACAGRYTIMWRQSAAAVVFPDDLGPIRSHLESGLATLRGCWYQIVLRELETLHGHPNRLREWAHLAIELAEKYA
jgi:hypothetical protein